MKRSISEIRSNETEGKKKTRRSSNVAPFVRTKEASFLTLVTSRASTTLLSFFFPPLLFRSFSFLSTRCFIHEWTTVGTLFISLPSFCVRLKNKVIWPGAAEARPMLTQYRFTFLARVRAVIEFFCSDIFVELFPDPAPTIYIADVEYFLAFQLFVLRFKDEQRATLANGYLIVREEEHKND